MRGSRPRQRGVIPVLAAWTLVLLGSGALAAEQTEVIDPFPRGDDTYVDASLNVSWEMLVREGRILREFRCLAHDTIEGGGAVLCPDGSRVLLARELVARRETHRLNLDTALAFRRYLVATLRVPVVLHDLTTLDYDAGVSSSNSSVDPYNIPSLFSVPNTGPTRAGVGDPTLTLRIAPLSFARDETQPTWILELGLPTGDTGLIGGGGCGGGGGVI